DTRWNADEMVLGVWTGKAARAYPVSLVERDGFIRDEIGGEPVVVLWEPRTRTAAAYRPVASQPRKYKAPHPDAAGVSPRDEGEPVAPGTPAVPPRSLRLAAEAKSAAGRFRDGETHSAWNVAGRCVEGVLMGWTWDWL